ncbi:hypothetical protein IFM89_036789 [Coptis chinensis]|uniref:Seven-in-absentia protein TRAF-like domain-containing protein n=1 Tax=Coptis chinensis TaxID=261450 RepID=A0A835HRF9_9MAGN|nr:hypothetical protein IFM89_036789 [Coptis chinensis]
MKKKAKIGDWQRIGVKKKAKNQAVKKKATTSGGKESAEAKNRREEEGTGAAAGEKYLGFRQFCLHFEAFQLRMAPVYMAFLRFMGDEDEAKKFNYSLEVG